MNPPPSRKRSRWGNSSSSSQRPPHPTSSVARVSEDDALQALLSQAQPPEDQTHSSAKHNRRYADKDHRPSRKDPRGGGSRGPPEHKNYYGPAAASSAQGNPTGEDGPDRKAAEKEEPAQKKQAPDFGLSGTLTKDSQTGNTYKGVVLKFREPPEARAPNTLWRFYVFKGEEQIDTLHISRQSAYLLGRNEDIADIVLHHASCSSQHAVVQFRALPNKETGKLKCCPYLMDLESTNGSFINGVRIDSARYYQLKKGDVLKFGASTREYVLLTANTKSLS